MLQAIAIGAGLLSVLSDETGDESFREALQRAIMLDRFDFLVEEWRSYYNSTPAMSCSLYADLYKPLATWVNESSNLEEMAFRYRVLKKTHKAFDRLGLQSGVNYGILGRADIRLIEKLMMINRDFSTQTLSGVPLLKTFGGSFPSTVTFEGEEDRQKLETAKKRLGIPAIDMVQVDHFFDQMLSWDEERFLVQEVTDDLITETIKIVPRSNYRTLHSL